MQFKAFAMIFFLKSLSLNITLISETSLSQATTAEQVMLCQIYSCCTPRTHFG